VRKTVLEMTQNILSAMDSDEVNSIGDTTESLQVAEVIRETFEEMVANRRIPSNEGLLRLEGLSNPDFPNALRLSDNTAQIVWLEYDRQRLRFVPPIEFLDRHRNLRDHVPVVDPKSGVIYRIYNNRAPHYWTTFDNEHLVFDSYDSNVESTMHESKSLAWGFTLPKFELRDDFVPDMESRCFPELLAEAKSVCFINFKGVSSAKEEQRSKRQRVRSQNDLWRADQRRPYNRTPDYGRKNRSVRTFGRGSTV
jgi:hypothetical protein